MWQTHIQTDNAVGINGLSGAQMHNHPKRTCLRGRLRFAGTHAIHASASYQGKRCRKYFKVP